MTTPLHDLLDDLARDADAAPPALAERAWTVGRRRRTRSRVQAVVAAAAALALLALVTPALLADVRVPQTARSASAGVDGHPERIGRQWWVRDLPDRPGPVAAVLDYGRFEELTWYAVRADGHRWRLPASTEDGQSVAVSADGRLVGYLPEDGRGYTVHDLAAGRRTVFDGVHGPFEPTQPDPGVHPLGARAPGRVSPDGRYLLLTDASRAWLLDLEAGSARALRRQGLAAGWAGPEQIVWLQRDGDRQLPIRAVTADLQGDVQADVVLQGTEGTRVGQWSGAVHPGSGRLAMVFDYGTYDGQYVREFVLATGRWSRDKMLMPLQGGCGPTWASDGTLTVPVWDFGPHFSALRTRAIHDEATREIAVVKPRLEIGCLAWAADALAGPAHGGGWFGTRAEAWTWWWKELLLGTVLSGLGLRALVRWRRARIAARPAVDHYA